MEYLSLGKIIDKHGLDGTAKVYSTTNNAKKRYVKGAKVFLYNEETDVRQEAIVESYRSSGQFDFLRFEGLTVNDIESLKGYEVQVIKDRNDLEVGYYFYSDLVGCEIVDQEQKVLGIVSKVEEFPAQITLRVRRNKEKDFFVPFVKQFIVNVDIDNKKITINVLEGML